MLGQVSSSRPPPSLRIRGGDIALLYESDRAEYFLFRCARSRKRKDEFCFASSQR